MIALLFWRSWLVVTESKDTSMVLPFRFLSECGFAGSVDGEPGRRLVLFVGLGSFFALNELSMRLEGLGVLASCGGTTVQARERTLLADGSDAL